MQSLELRGDGKIPMVGLGTYGVLGEQVGKTIKRAWELGYRHVDTARNYGNERDIGRAIKDLNREELFITSKVPPSSLTRQGVINSINQSLEDLGTDYVDLFLIHWPSENMDLEMAMEGFKKMRDEGKIINFGVSNFGTIDLDMAIDIGEEMGMPVTVNQIQINPRNNNENLRKYCQNKGVAVVGYSPLGGGEMTGNPVIEPIGEKYGKSVSQVIIRWLIQNGVVAIPKATSEQHLREDIEVFDFELSQDEMRILNKL
jgi:2,5-diketo-D-gluconate reductase B